jgi:hypothetical protein
MIPVTLKTSALLDWTFALAHPGMSTFWCVTDPPGADLADQLVLAGHAWYSQVNGCVMTISAPAGTWWAGGVQS